MLSQDIIDAVVAAAKGASIPPAALLAVVEIESGGTALEIDGRTPRLLFERHKFHDRLEARWPKKLAAAVKAGLAIPKWSPKTQYKDQGSSRNRLALLAKARAIDEESANWSCSWGLGQTMGFLAEELGYGTATDMVAKMTAGGIAVQIDMMLAEIRKKGLVDELQRQDWVGFAIRYNGPGYAKNQYDTKLAGAFRRWERWLAAAGAGTANPLPQHTRLTKREIEAVQQQLIDLGYPKIGLVDGKWGPDTTGAVSAFQAFEGLPTTGDYDDATRQALAEATPRAVSDARAATSADDLRAAGSQTVAIADKGRGIVKTIVGLGLAGGAKEAGDAGLLDQAQSAVDQVQAVRPLVDGARELIGWATSHWWIGALIVGFVLWRQFGAVIKRRVSDQVSGRHA